MISSFDDFFCLFLLRIVLGEDFFAVILQFIFYYVLKLVEVFLLYFKLILALELDFFESASMLIFFAFLVFFDINQIFPRLFNLSIEQLYRVSLLFVGDFHACV